MKKEYEKPSASLVELSFDEHIAGSGGGLPVNPFVPGEEEVFIEDD